MKRFDVYAQALRNEMLSGSDRIKGGIVGANAVIVLLAVLLGGNAKAGKIVAAVSTVISAFAYIFVAIATKELAKAEDDEDCCEMSLNELIKAKKSADDDTEELI